MLLWSQSATFPKAGTFAYHCKYHGAAGGQGMSGTIEVKAAGAPGALPRTGGEDAPVELVLGALALLAIGGMLTVRGWQRRA